MKLVILVALAHCAHALGAARVKRNAQVASGSSSESGIFTDAEMRAIPEQHSPCEMSTNRETTRELKIWGSMYSGMNHNLDGETKPSSPASSDGSPASTRAYWTPLVAGTPITAAV